jgi:hypothetical protein
VKTTRISFVEAVHALKGSTYLLIAGVSFGIIALFLIASGGCPFFPLFPPILVGTPCELSQTGNIGVIFGVTGGALVVAGEIRRRRKSTATYPEPPNSSDEDKRNVAPEN